MGQPFGQCLLTDSLELLPAMDKYNKLRQLAKTVHESLNTPKPVPSTVTTISETSLKKKYSALKESIVGALKQYCLEQGYREYTNEEGGVTKLFLTKAEYVKLGVIRALKKNVLEKAYNKVTSGARKRKTVVLMDMSYDEFLKLYTPLIYKYKADCGLPSYKDTPALMKNESLPLVVLKYDEKKVKEDDGDDITEQGDQGDQESDLQKFEILFKLRQLLGDCLNGVLELAEKDVQRLEEFHRLLETTRSGLEREHSHVGKVMQLAYDIGDGKLQTYLGYVLGYKRDQEEGELFHDH
eukprot:gene5690-6877_t